METREKLATALEEERAVLKAYGRPMDDETRYALAVMWKPGSGSHAF